MESELEAKAWELFIAREMEPCANGRNARMEQCRIEAGEWLALRPAAAPPEERREDDCQLRMDPKAELTMVLEDLKTRDQSIKDLHAACDAKTAYGKHQEEIKNRALRLLWTVQGRFSSESYETFRTLQGELEEFLNEVDEDQECYPMTYAPTEPADLPLPYQAEAIARGEMAERLRVAEREVERLRARTTELAAVRGGGVLEELTETEIEAVWARVRTYDYQHRSMAQRFVDELNEEIRSRLRSAPEGKVLVDAGELEALRATIAKLKEFHDPVNVAKRIEEYAAQHKPAQREVVPNGTGGWFMDGDQGQRTTTAANASQHPGQDGKGGEG